MRSNPHVTAAGLALLLIAGCSVHVKNGDRAGDDESKNKDVTIKSVFGGLNVRTNDVDPKDTGMSVYPGARLKQDEEGSHDKQANVNIETPFFGMKVVALTYLSDDPQEKIWDYYKKELSKYGKVLECKPGSPDMGATAKEKNQLTCENKGASRKQGLNLRSSSMELKVGTADHQRVVGFKASDKGTEFSIVYVVTHGDDKDKV